MFNQQRDLDASSSHLSLPELGDVPGPAPWARPQGDPARFPSPPITPALGEE
jgi:hypothetical protein